MSTATDTLLTALPAFPLLFRLVGEPFLFARRSYGDELVLHFGERRADPPRVIKGREWRYEYGTYSLHLRGSAWEAKGASGARDSSTIADGPREIELPTAAGARVTAVIPFPVDRPEVTGFGLRVELSDGSAVVVIPTPDGDESATAPDGTPLPPLADWELHSPYGNLVVGPGREVHVQHKDITLTDGSKFTWNFPLFVPMRHGGGNLYAPEPVSYLLARSIPIYTDEDNARSGIVTQDMGDLVPLRVVDSAMLQQVIAKFEKAGATHLAIDICT
ncbi:MAG TPA: hypothetical protein VH092_11475, partial [Urbifossiella sp.]|nr:hypothetical protein [Urbifossiella sp.]